MAESLLLSTLQRFAGLGLLSLRLGAGGQLWLTALPWVMHEGTGWRYVAWLQGSPMPLTHLLAWWSIHAQLAIGVAFVLGLGTRWAGLLCAAHFAAVLATVMLRGGPFDAFHSALWISIGLCLALQGCGRFGLDAWLERPLRQRFDTHY